MKLDTRLSRTEILCLIRDDTGSSGKRIFEHPPITLKFSGTVVTDPQRIVELESQIAHLQHDLDQLGSVVYEQRKLIEQLQAEHQKLTHRLEELKEGTERRDPETERPPHY
jgi:SlyX protein